MRLLEHILACFVCGRSLRVGANFLVLSLGFLVFVIGVLGLHGSASAQVELASAQARTAQFVFIVDDSGSMRVRTREGPAADPERLAVFGARSMLSMLDDADEASIVRLNGPADGEAPLPIAPLSENRKTLEGLLALDGVIARYPGKHTPCDSALAAVKQQLNAAYRPNVMQVVIFMTDGECTGRQPAASEFLSGLRSHADDYFQFYLLRWSGREYSKSLVTLAHETGGVAAEVGADDPTEILAPFASVLSRSQGYEAYLLHPAKQVLEAHRGAKRMRLLAVAPDRGRDLEFSIHATVKGKKPEILGAARRGVHQYEGGKRYRYAALDYVPGETPVTVSVQGAGNDWKVVAVPEYRLFVAMRLSEGRCAPDGSGAAAKDVHYVEVGRGVCATVELVNEAGQPVTADVAGRGTEAKIQYMAPGAEKAVSLPASRQGDAARFVFERANLSEGDYILTPVVTLTPAGLQGGAQQGVTIRGAARALQVSSQRVVADPARLDFGVLAPGAEQHHELTLRGNFVSGRGRLVVAGRKDVPDCVTFRLSGVPEGEGQMIHPNQPYSVGVHVAPYCGPSAFQRALDSALHIEFDRAANAQAMPSVVIPFQAKLNNQIAFPPVVSTALEAGQSKDVEVGLRGNHLRNVEFEAMLPPVRERAGWPGKELDVAFLDADGKVLRTDSGDLRLSQKVVFEAAGMEKTGAPLRVRVLSEVCCGGGKYTTELALIPASGSRVPVRIPVEVTVEQAGVWSCWGPTILRVLAGLLVLLLVLYVINMWRNSRFLRRDALANRIVPLVWDDFGEARPNTRAAVEVQKMVRRDLTRRKRAVAWLKANPLKFGLPGGAYNECCELVLNQSANVLLSSLRNREDADYLETVTKNPRLGLAKIYVSARGGTTFFTVKAEGNRVGTFFLQDDSFGFDGGFGEDEEFKPQVTTLRRATALHVMDSHREPDTMAGWRVG